MRQAGSFFRFVHWSSSSGPASDPATLCEVASLTGEKPEELDFL